MSDECLAEISALVDALMDLAKLNLCQCLIGEIRGLTVDEIAELLNVSPDAVMRDSRAAKS